LGEYLYTFFLDAIPPNGRPRVFTSKCIPHEFLDQLAGFIPLHVFHALVPVGVGIVWLIENCVFFLIVFDGL